MVNIYWLHENALVLEEGNGREHARLLKNFLGKLNELGLEKLIVQNCLSANYLTATSNTFLSNFKRILYLLTIIIFHAFFTETLQYTEYNGTSLTLKSRLTVLHPSNDTIYKCRVTYQEDIVAERTVPLFVYGLHKTQEFIFAVTFGLQFVLQYN